MLKCLISLLLLFAAFAPPAMALVRMDNQSMDLAITYGLQNQEMGYASMLGPNWMEGSNGVLLNIYTPFMLIATRASRAGAAHNPPRPEEIEAAKKYCARQIRDIKDPRIPLRIKFSVSFYSANPEDGLETLAWINGIGRGQELKLKPADQIRQKAGTLGQDSNRKTGNKGNAYEFINAYYFDFDDVAQLDDYTFSLLLPSRNRNAEPVTFHIRNKSIY